VDIKLRFLGAAQSVTGSRHLVEINGLKFLVDCGLYQEREFLERNWNPFPIPPRTIDAVLLTHAHIDHCGLLPKLAREGFKGPVYCTAATADISRIMLLDSAHIQEEDAAFKKRRHEREGRQGPYPEIPLYTVDEAKACAQQFKPVDYGETVRIGSGVKATFHDAGHVFGSSMVTVRVRQGGKRTLLFSGDIGRWNTPILRDPTVFDEADYVLVESTYGDRLHDDVEAIGSQLAEITNSTVEAGGNIVIPSFALERSQELIYYLNKLLMSKRIPRLKVFIDSPLAVRITEIFEKYPELYGSELTSLIRQGKSPFDFLGLTMVKSVYESKSINHIKGSVIIVAGSGMCTAGRIKHHLVANISRPESTILFVGHQAVGTLGRHIVDGANEVRILGQWYPVRARIVQINGLSAHADKAELFRWLSALHRPPDQVFVVHGEKQTAHQFADFVRGESGWQVSVPAYRDEVVLE
jgi:metallo-beta-lactamase family protein